MRKTIRDSAGDVRHCSFIPCGRPVYSAGLCEAHRAQQRRGSTPHLMKQDFMLYPLVWLEERTTPEPNSGCWLWLSGYDTRGYGIAKVKDKGHRAHRLVWTILRGEIPGGMVLDHLCRNHSCVNPAHLEPVTDRENILRGVGLAALNFKKTHCSRGHPFDDENTIRGIERGRPRRGCRECKRMTG